MEMLHVCSSCFTGALANGPYKNLKQSHSRFNLYTLLVIFCIYGNGENEGYVVDFVIQGICELLFDVEGLCGGIVYA